MAITVNFNRTKGRIKPVHGVGQPPFLFIDYSKFSYLKEAHIPFSRLHDVGGPYGRFQYVDIPNIFRDFDADPAEPASYDFGFTDGLITALVENGVEPFFRLGVTIENYMYISAYRIFPPKDYRKWARICEGIIRHYNEGWADGFHYNIRYWEIWNEPDNGEKIEKNPMWQGTKEQYYELYHVAATHLKKCFPDLMIGGYAGSGFYAVNGVVPGGVSGEWIAYCMEFFDGFMEYIQEHRSPLDFFSWHSYTDIQNTKTYAEYVRKRLDEAGYDHVEITCNEWNYRCELKGTMEHAADNTAMLMMFQDSPMDSAMFYDARIGLSAYGGLFHPMKQTPYPLYYGFQCFGELYTLGNQSEAASSDPKVFVCAAADGKEGGILIANTGEAVPLNLEIKGGSVVNCCQVDGENGLAVCSLPEILDKHMILYVKISILPEKFSADPKDQHCL